MAGSFHAGGAGFTGISPGDLYVESVVQADYLSVDETGTTAAAATGVGITASTSGSDSGNVVFDHPFLFLVRDSSSGAILFASEVNDPTS